MKKLALLLMLLALTGCAGVEEPVAAEPAPSVAEAVQEEAPAQPEEPEKPEEAAPALEAPEEIPAEPESAPPRAAYLYEDAAVAEDGSVVLCLPEHTLRMVRDALTGQPRYLLAVDGEGTPDGLYALDGTELQAQELEDFSAAGDLVWYRSGSGYSVLRVSDGALLAEGLEQVRMVGGRAALIPAFRLENIVFLDPMTGEETGRVERGFTRAEVTLTTDAYLPVRSPDGAAVNLVDSEGTPQLQEFVTELYDVCFGYAIAGNGDSQRVVIELSSQREVYRDAREFVLLPGSVLVCQRERQWQLQSWQGETLFGEVFIDRPIVYELDGVPQYLVGQVLRGTEFIPVIVRPDGTVLGELPADPAKLGLASAEAVTYVLKTGRGEEAHLRLLETGEDVMLARGGEIILSAGLERNPAEYEQVRRIETSGGTLFVLTVDNTLRLYLNDGTPARQDLGAATYLGGDVFRTGTGLRRLDGSWVYKG